MTNLTIEDIETLETLSLDELEQVVGGRGCYYKPFGRRFFRKFYRKMRKDMPIAMPPGPDDVFAPGDVLPEP